MTRLLNDYECMLVTSTCNVGLRVDSLAIADAFAGETREGTPTFDEVSFNIRQAWDKCVEQYALLQSRIVETGEIGVLGPRYRTEPIQTGHDALLRICDESVISGEKEELLDQLQRVGTSSLCVETGSYFLDCMVMKDDSVQIVISLCHALSDGPGLFHVAKTFLDNLLRTKTDSSCEDTAQELIDLQSLILDDDYKWANPGKDSPFNNVLPYANAVKGNSLPAELSKFSILPPEAQQKIPFDDGFGGPSRICALCFALSKEETAALRESCRSHGATIQGAVSVSSLLTRIHLLESISLPVFASLQIPVNCRKLATEISNKTCLCGSAGVLHTLQIEPTSNVWDLVRECTVGVRDGIERKQPKEWLNRLMNRPETLLPYSLMCSSIGVAPISRTDGLQDVYFFGGALANGSPSKAQATMLHCYTFDGAMQCTFNYTSPGIAVQFAHQTTIFMKHVLLALANLGDENMKVSEIMQR